MGGWAKIGENLNQYTNKMEEIFVAAAESIEDFPDLLEAMNIVADGSILISLFENLLYYKFGGDWYPIGGNP